jgi:hypothetical protein
LKNGMVVGAIAVVISVSGAPAQLSRQRNRPIQ